MREYLSAQMSLFFCQGLLSAKMISLCKWQVNRTLSKKPAMDKYTDKTQSEERHKGIGKLPIVLC